MNKAEFWFSMIDDVMTKPAHDYTEKEIGETSAFAFVKRHAIEQASNRQNWTDAGRTPPLLPVASNDPVIHRIAIKITRKVLAKLWDRCPPPPENKTS